MLSKILQLNPEYRDYLWGGERLRPGFSPIAEAWAVFAGDKVASGSLAGSTLSELAATYGAELLGKWTIQRSGTRFPLLIKLLDCAQWLSLQVHPTDELALQLEGPGHFGKTEAWVVLAATPEAQIIAGLQTGVTRATMQAALRNGAILELVQYHEVNRGDSVLMPAGTIHALGPGLLIYEVQQTSDLTYRVYDWGRPQTGGRVLHIDKAIAAANPASRPTISPSAAFVDGSQRILCSSEYFILEMLTANSQLIPQDTCAETFHALTVIEGSALVQAGSEEIRLEQFESAVIPAATGEYQIIPLGAYRLLKASVPAP